MLRPVTFTSAQRVFASQSEMLSHRIALVEFHLEGICYHD